MKQNSFLDTVSKIQRLANEKERVLVAIDGRCAAGKTTLASQLQAELQCSVIHVDDFFLQPQQRSESRMSEPGGNTDYERLLREVLQPLSENGCCSYRPYNCHTQSFSDEIVLTSNNVYIIEGAYSCHPKLWSYYDLHIFLSINSCEQLHRIRLRNGSESAKAFENMWIPLEEKYLTAFDIEHRCEIAYSQ